MTYLRMEPSEERLLIFLLIDNQQDGPAWVLCEEISRSASIEDEEDVINGLSMAAMDPTGWDLRGPEAMFTGPLAPLAMQRWVAGVRPEQQYGGMTLISPVSWLSPPSW